MYQGDHLLIEIISHRLHLVLHHHTTIHNGIQCCKYWWILPKHSASPCFTTFNFDTKLLHLLPLKLQDVALLPSFTLEIAALNAFEIILQGVKYGELMKSRLQY